MNFIDRNVKNKPIGGDPLAWCQNPDCHHHEMNHADYIGWPRKCNPTGCPCMSYVAPQETL